MTEPITTEPRRVVVSGSITTTIEVEADSIAEGVRAWQDKAGSGYPDGWEDAKDPDGVYGNIHGGCETCELPIVEGEPYFHDDDGITWHARCDDRYQDAEKLPPALNDALACISDYGIRERLLEAYVAALAQPPQTREEAEEFARSVIESQDRQVGGDAERE